jgi:hypothetical protein
MVALRHPRLAMLQFELFASVPCPPEKLWDLVGDPDRLWEWTDAEALAVRPEPPVAVGSRFATVEAGRRLGWVVITCEDHLWEAKTDDSHCGRLGIGVRVAPDAHGSRLVLAGMLEPAGSLLRARLVDVPRLRARLDRWSAAATGLVASG